jgi:hypothetical protein
MRWRTIAASLEYLAEVCAVAWTGGPRRVLPALLIGRSRPVPGGVPCSPARTRPGTPTCSAACRRVPGRAQRHRETSRACPRADALRAALDRLVDRLVRERLAAAGLTLGPDAWLAA